MEPHRLDQGGRKPAREIARGDILMLHIDAARRGLFVVGDEMADVMQQGRSNQGRRSILALGQRRALQGML
jgi:hypothetical protein